MRHSDVWVGVYSHFVVCGCLLFFEAGKVIAVLCMYNGVNLGGLSSCVCFFL